MKTFQPLLATSRLHLISFDQQTYDTIFSSAEKQEIMQIFGHQNDEEYEFNTDSKEIMEIISGKLEYQILNQTGWTLITDEMSFDVPAKSSFKVRVIQISHYCCSYIE